jgi:hypothetical protein
LVAAMRTRMSLREAISGSSLFPVITGLVPVNPPRRAVPS